MRTQIRVSCIDQQLKVVYAPILASGGLNEAEVVFDFCEKWDGFAKTGVFYRDEENVYYSLLDEDDTCIVPHEVYDEPGTFYFTVIGDRDGIRRTAITVRYKAQKGVVGEGMIPSDPTPDVYDQIINLMTEVNEKVDSGALAGPQGEPGYTPVKGVDYFDGYTPVKGVDYFDGENGTGVTVTNVSESNDDGGSNVVTFSDGSQLTVKNGSKGEKGDGTYDPLIVTGKIPATESTVSGVAQASVKNMALSHTIEEIAEAFQAGRGVTIRLNPVYPGMDNFGGWTFHYAELNVTKAEVVMAGYYTLIAYGTGYVGVATCTSAPIFVSGSLSTNPQIYVRTKTETATYAGEVEVN